MEDYKRAHDDLHPQFPSGLRYELHPKLRELFDTGKLYVRDPVTGAIVKARDWFPPVPDTDRIGLHEHSSRFQYRWPEDGDRIFIGMNYWFTAPVVTRPAYYTVQDELTAYAGRLVNLRPREAFVKFKGEPVFFMRTLEVEEPKVETDPFGSSFPMAQ